MPRIRTKTQPNKVREVSEKDLIDLGRWDMILEILPDGSDFTLDPDDCVESK